VIPEVYLNDACEFVLDGTHASPERVDSGVPVLSAQNVNGGELNFDSNRFTTETEYSSFGRRLDVRDGDVLLTIVGTIGRAAVVNKWRPAVFQRSVAVLRPKKDVLHNRFLFHVTQSSQFQTQLARATNQSSQAGVYLGKLGKTLIPLPHVAEQRRIAAILDRADEMRAKRHATLAQIDNLPQAIFLDLFGDPVVNKRSWPLQKLGDVGTLDRGVSKHRPRNAPELLGGSHPLVQTGEVANCDGYIRTHAGTYSDIGLRQSKMWPAGTLCITIAANIAKTGILTFNACFPDSVVGFLAKNPATVEFVRTWLSFLQKSLEDKAPESAQKNINLAILRELKIPFPSLQLQEEFARRVAAVEKLKAAHRASLAQFNALFASLQHRAFRGEL
jgi:type I restriction enzyme S subunit